MTEVEVEIDIVKELADMKQDIKNILDVLNKKEESKAEAEVKAESEVKTESEAEAEGDCEAEQDIVGLGLRLGYKCVDGKCDIDTKCPYSPNTKSGKGKCPYMLNMYSQFVPEDCISNYEGLDTGFSLNNLLFLLFILFVFIYFTSRLY